MPLSNKKCCTWLVMSLPSSPSSLLLGSQLREWLEQDHTVTMTVSLQNFPFSTKMQCRHIRNQPINLYDCPPSLQNKNWKQVGCSSSNLPCRAVSKAKAQEDWGRDHPNNHYHWPTHLQKVQGWQVWTDHNIWFMGSPGAPLMLNHLLCMQIMLAPPLYKEHGMFPYAMDIFHGSQNIARSRL
jgi:hypothetical protein